MSRWARRVDDNHREVVGMLEALGCRVRSLASVGQGMPDLLVLCDGVIRLVEVKDGRKSKSRRALTPAEQAFGSRWPVSLVECREDCVALVEAWRGVGRVEQGVDASDYERPLVVARTYVAETDLSLRDLVEKVKQAAKAPQRLEGEQTWDAVVRPNVHAPIEGPGWLSKKETP